VKVRQATSRQFAGQPVSLVHPNLRSLAPLRFCRPEDVEACDILFLALPNGESMLTMETWLGLAAKVIDLGADFRLGDPRLWKAWYGSDHAAPQLMDRFVYGVPEINRQRIREAGCVAGPGCEAIVSILCLYPLLKHGIIGSGPIIIDAKMGSSQVGNKLSAASHHPERAGVVRSYMPVGHRHTAEIERILGGVRSGTRVNISATSIEMVRGILVTIHAFMEGEHAEADIWRVLRSEYSEEPFIRIVKQRAGLYRCPEPKILQGTNICEVGFEMETRENRLVLLGAIDNLVKGTAGNAVQCMNLMTGIPETTGLEFPGLHPV
jgi:N-acetyl-gamma-glutamyl-phosphate/LysW-gamma-L-alpha-aminoadipyl-6-phosphate reductase